ncbi:50S ribosomal protein L37ae [Candidatus Woesearchaeota archaeon]|nr:50S ribosomal protein L37ae [Candidatus Woesearchaeota archaeon]
MAKEKGLGPVKRFGARYGATTKHRLASIEKEQKKSQKCPYCSKQKAKRISYGIYECKKCHSKFTGRAYFTGIKTKQYEAQKEEPINKEGELE